MKITIDTKEDTPEEIRKAVAFLKSIVGDHEVITNQGNIFEDSKPADSSSGGNAFLSMFGSDSPAASSSPSQSDSSAASMVHSQIAESQPEKPKKGFFDLIEYC